jgi:hypothetical protein
MALTDRNANQLLNKARVASNVDIANADLLSNQLDQRHVYMSMSVSQSITYSQTLRYAQFVADRAYKVISARLISPMPITAFSTVASAVSFMVVANNDANGADTILAQLQIATTTVQTFASQALVVTASNTVASTQQVDLVVWTGNTNLTSAISLPPVTGGIQPYVVDLVVQEV